MGHCKNGSCPCGYECSVVLGASMAEHSTVDHFPFLCSDCAEIVSLNIKLMPGVKCYRCEGANVRPLTDPDLSDLNTNRESMDNTPYWGPPFIKLEDYIMRMQEDFKDVSDEELRIYDVDLRPEKLAETYEEESKMTMERFGKPFWGLHSGVYYCPKCQKISMRFEQGIFFD